MLIGDVPPIPASARRELVLLARKARRMRLSRPLARAYVSLGGREVTGRYAHLVLDLNQLIALSPTASKSLGTASLIS